MIELKKLRKINTWGALPHSLPSPSPRNSISSDKPFKYQRGIEYWLVIIGYAIGYGSFWRFPYLVYSCGGGVFLIPFFFFLFTLGIPLFCLESAYGQLFRKGPVEVFNSIRLKFKGIGWACIFAAWVVSVYYALILCWSVYYLYLSFFSPLPWANHNISTNITEAIHLDFMNQEFFANEVLKKSGGIENMGEPVGHLFLCLIITYIMIYFCIYNGIDSSSKVVYVTAPAPIILLLILLLKGFQLDGFQDGLSYLFYPNLSKLYSTDVWIKAANQVIFMLGLGLGGNILFASYRNENEDIYFSSYMIPLMTIGCGMLCSIINFCYLGHVSFVSKIAIDDLPLKGTDLAFITYPSALTLLPYPNLWSIVFFIMLITLGIDSQFAFIECVAHYTYEFLMKKYCSRKTSTALICILGFLVGIPFIYNGGFFLFDLVDGVATLVSLFIVLFLEAFLACQYIGCDEIQEITANSTNKTIPKYIFFSLKYICPLMLMILSVLSIEEKVIINDFKLSESKKYTVLWPIILEWTIIIVPLGIIIYYLIYYRDESHRYRIENEKELITN